MKLKIAHYWIALVAIPALLTGCASWKFTHVPPGQSVEVALAKRAVPVEQAATKIPTLNAEPAAEPTHTTANMDGVATVSDYFTLGCLFMEQGNYADATGAFEDALKLDPGYSEAWNKLAICYQNSGQQEKAIETFRKSKALSAR